MAMDMDMGISGLVDWWIVGYGWGYGRLPICATLGVACMLGLAGWFVWHRETGSHVLGQPGSD